MKNKEPQTRSKLALQLTGMLIVVIFGVVASIKLRDTVGGTPGTIVFMVILGGLAFLVRRYIERYVAKRD